MTMKYKAFSKKQLKVLNWWCPKSDSSRYDGIICDGAVRSGKTLCMSVSFVSWAMFSFNGGSFAICGKTIRSVRRNIISSLTSVLKELSFNITEKLSSNFFEVEIGNTKNRFYIFGGQNEASASLIQGMTLCGVLFDEAALMPRSFVEQALARCSVEKSKLWFNCNPEYPQHWFYREWIQKVAEKNIFYIHFSMEDNPSLSKEMLDRYKKLYSGAFYERFVLGKWTAAEGIIYPFMSEENMLFDVPGGKAEEYIVSCDYGTVNPSSFGLWGKYGGVWYRTDEYYYDSREKGSSRTDEEHYMGLRELTGNKKISKIIVDPSAASFIETIRRHGEYNVLPAKNNVVDGIRQTSTALKNGKIRICRCCRDIIREFGLYRWNSGSGDSPVKENDHAMDDMRYFVSTELNGGYSDFFVSVINR